MDQSNPHQPINPWPPEEPSPPSGQSPAQMPPGHHPHQPHVQHHEAVNPPAFQSAGESSFSPPEPAPSQPEIHVFTESGSRSETPAFQPAPPASSPANFTSSDGIRPVPVVRVLSPVGVEYVFLTFSLFIGAIGLASALLVLVNGKTDFEALAFPTAMLVVAVPLFGLLFLHLKQLELRRPELKLDPSKRRSTQFSQIASFVVVMFTLIGLVSSLFAKMGGLSSVSIGKALLDALCVVVVAGGILAYYWRDEHRG